MIIMTTNYCKDHLHVFDEALVILLKIMDEVS